MTSSLEADDVRKAARGRWMHILNAVAGAELGPALKSVGSHVPCPVHSKGRGGDGFRLFKDAPTSGGGVCNTCGFHPDGFALLKWLKGWTFPETLSEVGRALGMGEGGASPAVRAAPLEWAPEPAAASPEDDERIKTRLMKTWRDTVPLFDDAAEPARRWLRRRGQNESVWAKNPSVIRFAPSLPYYDKERKMVTGHFPAIVAMMHGQDGNPVTLHRTYITEEGDRAPVPSIRKQEQHTSYRCGSGLYVPISNPVGRVLGLCEGLETGNGVTLGTGMTVWPTTTWSLMVNFRVLDDVDDYVIWADKDRSGAGQRFALKAQQNIWAQGKRCQVHTPPFEIPDGNKGIDWSDVYQQYGAKAFPRVAALGRLAAIA